MRFHIRKESVLKFNRTIICVCWYLDFILEKTPVGKKFIKPNEIEHLFEPNSEITFSVKDQSEFPSNGSSSEFLSFTSISVLDLGMLPML